MVRLFEGAEDEINKTYQASRDTNFFSSYKISPAVDDKLDKVIEKCSKLLQFYEKSNWIDDALLIIGKAYTYKGVNDAAIGKFEELLANFPTSNLKLETKLWLAKANYFAHKDDDALKIVTEIQEESFIENEDDIFIEAIILEGHIYFKNDNLQQAAISYAKATKLTDSNDLRAFAEYRTGEIYELLGDYSKASDAYKNTFIYKPQFSLEYRARLAYGRMLSILGQYDEALNSFELLEEEELKPEEVAQIELEIARTYAESGDTAKAFSVYTFIDTTYKKTDASAKSYYDRGLLFEKKYLDFKNARDCFEKAKNEFASSTITLLAQKKYDNLTKYFRYYDDLHKYDSLLVRSLIPDSVSSNNIDSVIETNQLQTKATEHIDLDSSTQQNDTTRYKLQSTTTTDTTIQTNESINKEIESEDIDDSTNSPDSLNRRVESGEQNNLLTQELQNKFSHYTDSIKPQINLRHLASQNKLEPDSIRNIITQVRYELASLFLLELDIPDSALYWYDKVVNENQNQIYVPRSIYALAEIYRSKNNVATVDSLYQQLLNKFEKTDYANHVKKILGLNIDTVEIDSAKTTYERAEKYLLENDTLKALQEYSSVANIYPKSPYAPQAIYTIGWIFENLLLRNDSAEVYYRRLINDYANSIYAENVKPKITVKDKPDSLPQFIKIKEIKSIEKQSLTESQKLSSGAQNKEQKGDEETRKGRRIDKNVEEEPEEEEEEPDVQDKDED